MLLGTLMILFKPVPEANIEFGKLQIKINIKHDILTYQSSVAKGKFDNGLTENPSKVRKPFNLSSSDANYMVVILKMEFGDTRKTESKFSSFGPSELPSRQQTGVGFILGGSKKTKLLTQTMAIDIQSLVLTENQFEQHRKPLQIAFFEL